MLAVAINAEGTVDAVKVVCSLEPGLDRMPPDAAKHWKFTPATKDGKPVPVQIEVSTNFRTVLRSLLAPNLFALSATFSDRRMYG